MQYFPQPMMMGGGQYSPSPTPLGYGGYFGGYYNGNMYNTFNPYEVQRRNEEMQKQQQQMLKMQQDILYKTYSAASKGQELDPNVVSRIYGTVPQQFSDPIQNMEYNSLVQKEQALQQNNAYIDQMTRNMMPTIPFVEQNLGNLQKMQQGRENLEGMDMYTYFATVAQDDLREATNRETMRQQANLTNLYSTNSYQTFLNKFRMGMPYDPNASTDDMTIRLPSIVSEQERMERRRQFMAQLGINI